MPDGISSKLSVLHGIRESTINNINDQRKHDPWVTEEHINSLPSYRKYEALLLLQGASTEDSALTLQQFMCAFIVDIGQVIAEGSKARDVIRFKAIILQVVEDRVKFQQGAAEAQTDAEGGEEALFTIQQLAREVVRSMCAAAEEETGGGTCSDLAVISAISVAISTAAVDTWERFAEGGLCSYREAAAAITVANGATNVGVAA